MISVVTALRLRDAGLRWRPASGDRFAVTAAELLDQVFVLSDMTIEVHDFPTGPVIGFNGTTEWALDSVDQDEAVWLPHEHQLREALAGTFRRLERDGSRWRVTIAVPRGDGTDERSFVDDDPAEAYAAALLHLLGADEA